MIGKFTINGGEIAPRANLLANFTNHGTCGIITAMGVLKVQKPAENNKPESIPYYVHEEQIFRTEVHAKRWAIAALIAFIALLATNICWFVYETSFQDVVLSENTLDGGGVNIVSNGDVAYGDKTKDIKD